MFDLYYNGYCNTCLWPIFHSTVPTVEHLLKTHDLEEYADFTEARMYSAFVSVNQRFADVVKEVYNEPSRQQNDLVYIHGYNLFLLPSMLRQLIPEASIGFFLHIPFPSTEFFRILPMREELLRGVLGSSLIGFQTFGYARHFISACTRILGLKATPAGCDFNGHFAKFTIAPVGVEPAEIKRFLSHENNEALIKDRFCNLQEAMKKQGVKVLVGVDYVKQSSGLVAKFLAFEEFLEGHPELREKVVLIQVLLVDIQADRDLLTTLYRISGRVNGAGKSVIGIYSGPLLLITRNLYSGQESEGNFLQSYHFNPVLPGEETRNFLFEDQQNNFTEHGHLTIDSADDDRELCVLLSLADIYLDTSFRCGMNIRPFEYVVFRTFADLPSTVIVSEFSGAAHVLGGGSLLINPHDVTQVAETIDHALNLSEKEKTDYDRYVTKYVFQYTATKWMNNLASRLQQTQEASNSQGYLRKLEAEELVSAFKSTSRRLLVFDYETVLAEEQSLSQLAAPTESIIQLLKALTSDAGNRVVLVSHRTKEFMDKHFLGISSLSLVAEGGAFVRFPGKDWFSVFESPINQLQPRNTDFGKKDQALWNHTWRDELIPLFEYYRERTPGSSFEVCETYIAWSWHDADEQHGAWQANNLFVALVEFSSKMPILSFIEHKRVAVKIPTVSKATMLLKVMDWFRMETGCPDLILLLTGGEDDTDEDMFHVLMPGKKSAESEFAKNWRKKKSFVQFAKDYMSQGLAENALMKLSKEARKANLPFSLPWNCYTVVVGVRVSSAREYIASVPDVVDLLTTVVNR
eukprot:maker-scaffold_11-snap-gene-10.17-mRNA-1 protein AED:0.39 eAED:0.39 QI:0/0/0/1/1/1/2/0/802